MARGPIIAGTLLAGAILYAERLPVVSLTTANGLASNTIHKIVRDSRGFLWFCTGEGLSRFDGNQFVNFASAQGLPGRTVWDFTETRSGDYWVATSGGLVRLPGEGRIRSDVFYPADDARSRIVLAVKESSDGTLWAGTEGGLYRKTKDSLKLTAVNTGPPPESWSEPPITALEEDGAGNLWFGSYAGIGRIRKDGRIDRWTPRHGFASYVVASLFKDTDGTIWAGTEKALCHMLAEPRPNALPVERCYGRKEGLPSPYIQSILRTSAGTLWVATLEGAAYASTGSNAPLTFINVAMRQGLSDNNIEALAEDIEGNLWLGAADDGAMKLSRENVVLFTEADGLADDNVVALFEDREGRLNAVTRSLTNVVMNQFDGRRFTKTNPFIPASVHVFGRGFQQVALQDRTGEWWIATGDGLLRYPAGRSSELRKQPQVYVRPVELGGTNVFRVYEDWRGDIWWSTSARTANTLGRWDHATQKMQYFTDADGLPPLHGNLPSAFVEDRDGTLWSGFQSNGLARRRRDGSFEYFDPKNGWPGGRTRTAYRDIKGRLWFGSSTGLWRLNDPAAAKPVFRRYTPAEGLSSLTIHSLTGDLQGRIYVGTGMSLDRLDPDSGQIRYFSTSDGLPSGIIQASYRDRDGQLWFATRHGVARLIPASGPTREAPTAVRVTAIKVRGVERPVAAGGETGLAGLSLPSGEDQIEFAFSAPRFRASNELLYQYRLEGARSADWSPPSNTRSVNFASLPAGSYRFEVRAANSQGITGMAPATVAFAILPPFWLTWWFQLAFATLVAAAVYAFYRYRIRLALEREHLRMRIATDLHDDIGSSLSRIAIWSEVAAQEAERSSSKLLQPLSQIGVVSREVIDSMSDIVWAVNPQHDRFNELASRMRRYVSDLSAGANIPISFTIQGEDRETAVGPAARREVFLVFKEALNNVLRHAECTKCSTALALDSGWVSLEVADDGKGFDTATRARGHGLDSMQRRAKRLGGTLRVDSAPGRGTRLELRVPRSALDQTDRARYLHK
jgi:ligand-binding sensor domain-containing protein/signal transduction histidine kinase